MPCARQPKAPCVLVCESPQTTVMPGSVAPCSGPDHVHDALALVEEREIGLGAGCSRMLASSVSTWRREVGSSMPAMPRSQPVVGVL